MYVQVYMCEIYIYYAYITLFTFVHVRILYNLALASRLVYIAYVYNVCACTHICIDNVYVYAHICIHMHICMYVYKKYVYIYKNIKYTCIYTEIYI